MSLYKELKTAIKEEDVNHTYRNFLTTPMDGNTPLMEPHKIKVDGLLKLPNFCMLLEFKYDTDFTKRSNMIEVIIQVIYYLKQFENLGEDLPHMCFVGDVNECFYFHSNDVISYLSLDIDWSIAPSTAGKKNTKLSTDLYNDKNINPYVHKLNDGFNITVLLEKIINLSKGVIQKEHVTEKNVNRLFDYFVTRIIRGKKLNKKTANELVSIFITTILNKDENYIHPHKPNTLITKSFGNITVNGNVFKPFFDHYQMNFSLKERDKLTAICDRLIEDTTRRFKGEFFTPTEWVDEAHKMITEEFGEDWKEKYVVYDPACGTLNLTRDYKFKELYCSTLNQSDIDIANQMDYNPEAVKFQFDFLNDPDDKLPDGLKKALEEKKPIIVFMNPPYGTATEATLNVIKERKAGIAKNSINIAMLEAGMGRASDQLYTQFIFHSDSLSKHSINFAIFTKPLFLSGMYFKKFRKFFLEKYNLKSAMLFNASHFSNTSNMWGISFSIWQSCEALDKINFQHIIKDYDKNNKIITLAQKSIYNTDDVIALSDWIRMEIRGIKIYDEPKLKGPLSIIENNKPGRRQENSIGFMHSNSNQVQYNSRLVGLYTSSFSAENAGLPVTQENYNKCTTGFCARRTIIPNWINDKDEYLAPDTEHPEYKQWNNDCLVYSLFNNSSNQSSLRDITYKDKQWDIINEWFWMSRDHIQLLAEINTINGIEQDIKNFGGQERFVYNRLQEISLSDDAKKVLNKAIELVEDSFEYRKTMIEEYPEYHLNTWDCGFYQIKKVLKKYMPDELKAFRILYKKFEDRMREGVYIFGFLKR